MDSRQFILPFSNVSIRNPTYLFYFSFWVMFLYVSIQTNFVSKLGIALVTVKCTWQKSIFRIGILALHKKNKQLSFRLHKPFLWILTVHGINFQNDNCLNIDVKSVKIIAVVIQSLNLFKDAAWLKLEQMKSTS